MRVYIRDWGMRAGSRSQDAHSGVKVFIDTRVGGLGRSQREWTSAVQMQMLAMWTPWS